jgi:ankyrin repeat protein
VEVLIAGGARINAVEGHNMTALHYTCFGCNRDEGKRFYEIVCLLCAEKADLSIANTDGKTALQLAQILQLDDIAYVLTMAEGGSKKKKKKKKKRKDGGQLSEQAHAEVAEVKEDRIHPLLWAGVHPANKPPPYLVSKYPDCSGRQIHAACREGEVGFAKVRYMIIGGADPCMVDEHGRTPLGIALSCNDVELGRMLLSPMGAMEGARVDAVDSEGATMLHRACGLRGRLAFVEMLLDKGANIHALFHGRKALSIACAMGNVEIARLLLEVVGSYTSEVDQDENRLSPMQHALRHGQTAIVDLLVQYGADLWDIDAAKELSIMSQLLANQKQLVANFAVEAVENQEGKDALEKESEELEAASAVERQRFDSHVELMADRLAVCKGSLLEALDEQKRQKDFITDLGVLHEAGIAALAKKIEEQGWLQGVIADLNGQYDDLQEKYDEAIAAIEVLEHDVEDQCDLRQQLEAGLLQTQTPVAVTQAALQLADNDLATLEVFVIRERARRAAVALQWRQDEALREVERGKEEIRREMRAELEQERAAMRRDGEVMRLPTPLSATA